MIAITGITGKVGGGLANRLLEENVAVRAVVRDAAKGEAWRRKGCDLAVGELTDVNAMTRAFQGAEAVFILPPPVFDPQPGFSEAYKTMGVLRDAVRSAGVARVLYLSTIGAQARQTNLLSQHTIGEEIFGELEIPVTFLRAAWFLENTVWDIPSARQQGILPSFLQPAGRPVPMVATEDISKVAAELIVEPWRGHRVVELEGPERISPAKLAGILTRLLDRPVEAQPVPRETWETIFTQQGMQNPYPRIRMLDGFNEGWIEFEGGQQGSRKGETNAEIVLRNLLTASRG